MLRGPGPTPGLEAGGAVFLWGRWPWCHCLRCHAVPRGHRGLSPGPTSSLLVAAALLEGWVSGCSLQVSPEGFPSTCPLFSPLLTPAGSGHLWGQSPYTPQSPTSSTPGRRSPNSSRHPAWTQPQDLCSEWVSASRDSVSPGPHHGALRDLPVLCSALAQVLSPLPPAQVAPSPAEGLHSPLCKCPPS